MIKARRLQIALDGQEPGNGLIRIDDDGVHYLLRSMTETMLEHLKRRTQSQDPADAGLRRISELTTELAELTERSQD